MSLDKKKLYFLHFTIDSNNVNKRANEITISKSSILFNKLENYIEKSYKIYSNGKYSFIPIVLIPNSPTDSHIVFKNAVKYETFENINLQDKVLYRTPKLNLPTVKVNLLKEKYNLSVKRDPDKADYIITSEKYIESLLQNNWAPVLNSGDLYLHFETLKHHFDEYAWNELVDFFTTIGPDQYVKMKCNYDFNSFYTSMRDIIFKYNYQNQKYCWYIKDLNSLEFLENPKNKIVLDSDIIKFCNEDSVTLTINDMKSIVSMLKSQDKVNHSMALELLSNCNIEKSFDKIALVFAFYYGTIKYTNNWNHVNVKSLRKAMEKVPEINSTHRIYEYNELIKLLHEKDMLTDFAFKAVQQRVFNQVLGRIGFDHSSCVFDIKASDIKLKDIYNNVDNLSN